VKSINALMAALVCELIEGDIPHPLTQELSVFALWSDLCRLAGEPVPPAVAALLDAPAALCLPAVPPAFRAALVEPVRVAELEPA
jgi:hypothetical protein